MNRRILLGLVIGLMFVLSPILTGGARAEDAIPTVYPDGATRTYYVATGCEEMMTPFPPLTDAACDLANNRAEAYSENIVFPGGVIPSAGGAFWTRVWKSVYVAQSGNFWATMNGWYAADVGAGMFGMASATFVYEVRDTDTGSIVASYTLGGWTVYGLSITGFVNMDGGIRSFGYQLAFPGTAGHHYALELKVTADSEGVADVAYAAAIRYDATGSHMRGIWFTSVSIYGTVPTSGGGGGCGGCHFI